MKLLIAGYYGFGNEGDELLLMSLLQRAKPRGHALTVLSHDPQATQQRHQVRAINRWSLREVLSQLRVSDALVFGGGGLIQDLSGPWTPGYYLGLLAAAHALHKKTILLGQGLGPLQRGFNQTLARWILPRVDRIVARDAASMTGFQNLGVPGSRMRLGADLAWLLPPPTLITMQKAWGVCLRADWLQQRVPPWAKTLQELAREQGRSLRWIALGNRGDQALLTQLRQDPQFHDDHFIGEEEPDAQARFQGLEWVISMRYHGLILAARSGAMLTGWGHDPKLAGLMKELEQPMLSTAPGKTALAEIWKQRKIWQQKIQRARSALIQRAELGADWLP